MRNPVKFRLLNLCGGVVTRYGNYSNGALTFGRPAVHLRRRLGSASFKTLADGELVVMFGDSPLRHSHGRRRPRLRPVGGHGAEERCASSPSTRAAATSPRTATCEWIPIRPGTDAALVAGIAHELIKSDYGRPRLPAHLLRWLRRGDPAARRRQAKQAPTYAYVMGTGYDMVEKTPAWAAAITPDSRAAHHRPGP